jgi:hypothetical protein
MTLSSRHAAKILIYGLFQGSDKTLLGLTYLASA